VGDSAGCAWRSSTRKRGAVTGLILRAVGNYSYRRSANCGDPASISFAYPPGAAGRQ
jgi:hypothetical protein